MAFLSLDDLERYDPRGGPKRYCCPRDECRSKPIDAAHRTVIIDRHQGFITCFRCGFHGQLAEWRDSSGRMDGRPKLADVFELHHFADRLSGRSKPHHKKPAATLASFFTGES